ncbi:transporter substrate-binding domain-containing protein [Jeotgalibaca sp. MA1X17-3]|uniref:transporter substrate-binding domain-containing protein n=1 Tax=Jeotgalibaca sp. MA1X17-3 TaxID=2908211 RepID=UPI001F1DFEDD|nr:transporter substrate-binding domain-containing protein [Jeotgalibaca sp. MA1X17-3]UJF15483.1 transporter substrate-binding domain-containing protein [Jeotgalibaca sp. MA1X17-3]
MKKKKIALLAFTSLSATLLAACGSTGDSDSNSATSGAGASDATVYAIGTDTTFAPFEFENDEGDFVGIDLDLLDAIAKNQGFEYELRSLGFNAAVTALEAGQVDGVIAGMSINEEREKKYDFSDPYYDSKTGVAVKPDSGITSLEDLEGKQVVVKTGTTGSEYAEANKDEYGFTVKYVEDSSTMYQDVLGGNSAATFEDYPVIQYEISRGMKLEVVDQSEEGSEYGFATLKGKQTELVEKFNAGLAELRENGEYDEILDRYLGDSE